MCEDTYYSPIGLVQVWHPSRWRAVDLRDIPRFAGIVLGEANLIRVGIEHPVLEPMDW